MYSPNDVDYRYGGSELRLFANARNWKSYFHSQIKRYLGSTVLEVGSGLGATTRILCSGKHELWMCLEPDRELAGIHSRMLELHQFPKCCKSIVGTLKDVCSHQFDTILYIDVLEHIENDRAEVEQAAQLLRPAGHLVVLSPAFQWLYSPFDQAVGHYRRYYKGMLARLSPGNMNLIQCKYLDSIGYFASLTNRLLLNQAVPSLKQVLLWDRCFVPISRLIDPILLFSFGKSLLAIWEKQS